MKSPAVTAVSTTTLFPPRLLKHFCTPRNPYVYCQVLPNNDESLQID